MTGRSPVGSQAPPIDSAAGDGSSALPDRPPISTPTELQSPQALAAARERLARQPGIGFAGLLFVIPIAVLIAIGVGGPQRSVQVLGPLVTFALPVVAMVAFWWEDWPGSSLKPALSGWFDTLVIAVLAVGLTLFGQVIVAHADLRGVFDPTPGAGHPATYPFTLPLAGAAFTAMLEVTLVNEGWPLRRLPRIAAGLGALAVAWVIALVIYYLLLDVHAPAASGVAEHSGPVSGPDLGATLTIIGVWQVWIYIAWRGWPFAAIRRRAPRLLLANTVVIGGGIATFAVIRHGIGAEPATITAGAGAVIATGLVVGMLFENAVRPHLTPVADRITVLVVILSVAVVVYAVLDTIANGRAWTRVSKEDWIAHACLNALGVSVILHVAVGHRWPFARRSD